MLENLFSFLRRKTDFFTGASTKVVEDMVLKVVRKQSALNEQTEAEKRLEREKEERKRKERILKQKEQEEREIREQKKANNKASEVSNMFT